MRDGWLRHPDRGSHVQARDASRLRLPLLRPEATDHVARVLARGLRCPTCGGGGIIDDAVTAYDRRTGEPYQEDGRSPCDACEGTGYLRKPAPAWHLVDAERTGALTREQVAAAIGWSALSVARGGGVLRGVIVRRSSGLGVGWNEHHAPVQLVVHPGGWEITEGITYSVIAHGPETGPEGRICADRAALTAGFALLADDGTIAFPETPDAC